MAEIGGPCAVHIDLQRQQRPSIELTELQSRSDIVSSVNCSADIIGYSLSEQQVPNFKPGPQCIEMMLLQVPCIIQNGCVDRDEMWLYGLNDVSFDILDRVAQLHSNGSMKALKWSAHTNELPLRQGRMMPGRSLVYGCGLTVERQLSTHALLVGTPVHGAT